MIEPAAVDWGVGEPPRSRLYEEGYFSGDDGLGEARAVFLAGCGLPERWRGRRRFVVGELGLGTGRTLLALLDLWARARPAGGRLHVFSVEAHPMAASDAARALARWPEIAPLAAHLLARWPPPARGFHRLDFPQIGATVDIALMEAAAAVAAWLGRADAWFLDGFSPARNPAMWRAELLQTVARRSAPAGRAASFTVAGHVRRGLTAAGFHVERRPGFGRKRQRLEARLPGEAPADTRLPTVAIVGGGVAGAALARAFAAIAVKASVFAAPSLAPAHGPAALVAPRLDAGLAAPAALFAQAFARATRLYGAVPAAVISRGAAQSAAGDKDAARFHKIAASDLFAPASVRFLAGAPAELVIDDALVVEPAAILGAWLGEAEAEAATVAALVREADGWRLLDGKGAQLARADIVCLAAGFASASLADLPLAPVRGQASRAEGIAWPRARLFPGGYAVPTRDGVLFGATHDRGDADPRPRAADHARNLALIAALPELAAQLAGQPLAAHSGVRATTGDYLPLAGRAPDGRPGLMVLSGLGSRGFTLAPLLAEHVAALSLGAPSPLPADIARLVEPARFAARAARRRRAAVF